ncbi:DUF6455 family protein [Shimia abyssi]|uniref:DUF6455 domain-containing protein n=1 Tax=Shimia abyssi TaxID=1662395 RepID=A0A2P8FJR1_9RHOB|nr:DUF6455 family protein [Shimia abyssi]PSL21938.1 hypothetical protein CLV88_101362 [Shimia abyssi]
MKPLGDSNTHFWLAQRMARITDTDLVTAMARAEITQADWAEMITACRGCDWTKGCQRWLARHAGEHDQDIPQDCENHDRFQRLKDVLDEGTK